MASESSSERTVSITLPGELDDWLDEQAALDDVDREQLFVELLMSYRAAIENTEEGDGTALLDEEELTGSIQAEVREQLGTQLDEQLTDKITELLDEQLSGKIANQIDEQLESQVESTVNQALTGQVTEATNSVQRQLTNRIDTVETEFDQKIEDVRNRVIQVKKEADSKAPAEHHHEAFETLDDVDKRVAKMEDELASLRAEFDQLVPGHEETIDDVSTRIEQMQERLQTVAWVVSDLREAHESKGGLQAVERIKRAAAKADVERANCENCGESVVISLLTDPKCPHCDATVSNVKPGGGWFSKPQLQTASQLESGDET